MVTKYQKRKNKTWERKMHPLFLIPFVWNQLCPTKKRQQCRIPNGFPSFFTEALWGKVLVNRNVMSKCSTFLTRAVLKGRVRLSFCFILFCVKCLKGVDMLLLSGFHALFKLIFGEIQTRMESLPRFQMSPLSLFKAVSPLSKIRSRGRMWKCMVFALTLHYCLFWSVCIKHHRLLQSMSKEQDGCT